MHGIFDQVVEGLLELVDVGGDERQRLAEFLLHDDVAVLDLRLQERERLAQGGVDADHGARGVRGPDGAEELVDDGVEPADLAAGDADRLEQIVVPGTVGALAQVALEQLQVNIERVERIAQLVRHAGSQQGDGVELLRLDRLPRLVAPRGEVVEDDREAHQRGLLVLQRHEIEVEIARLGVEDFEVAVNQPPLGEDGRPVEFLQVMRDRRAERARRVDADEALNSVVEVENLAGRIDDDDAFLQRVEDRLEEALLVVEPLEIGLQVALADAVDAVEELVEERVFHDFLGERLTRASASCGARRSARSC